MAIYLNPDIFLLTDAGRIVLWNVKDHRQFSIDLPHANRVMELAISPQPVQRNDAIERDLEKHNIVSRAPYENRKWGWDKLSEIFHTGTSDIAQPHLDGTGLDWAKKYISSCTQTLEQPIPKPRHFDRSPSLPLPPPNLSQLNDVSLWKSLSSRRTTRVFDQTPITIERLSSLLHATFGFLTERESTVHEFTPATLRHRRSSPSGGGLNATEAYPLLLNVDGIASGLYHYSPTSHALHLITTSTDGTWLSNALNGQYFSAGLSFGVFMTGRFDRMWWKYPHSRAYRVSLMEVGHLSQTFLLAATASNFRTWLTAAFNDRAVMSALEIDTPGESPLLFVGAGYGPNDDLDVESRKLLAGHWQEKVST